MLASVTKLVGSDSLLASVTKLVSSDSLLAIADKFSSTDAMFIPAESAVAAVHCWWSWVKIDSLIL